MNTGRNPGKRRRVITKQEVQMPGKKERVLKEGSKRNTPLLLAREKKKKRMRGGKKEREYGKRKVHVASSGGKRKEDENSGGKNFLGHSCTSLGGRGVIQIRKRDTK